MSIARHVTKGKIDNNLIVESILQNPMSVSNPLAYTSRHDHGDNSANPLFIQQALESIPCKVSIMERLSRIV